MRVTALRFSQKFALENYGGNRFEMQEISVEAFPDDGQSADDLLADAKAFIAAHAPGNGKPAAPPLANGNGKKAEPKKQDAKPEETPAEKPERSVANGNGKKRGKGRPPKAFTEAKKAVEKALESEDLEEFSSRFNEARYKAEAFTVDEWEEWMKRFADTYRKLNGPEEDPETVAQVISAFKSEKTALESRREAE